MSVEENILQIITMLIDDENSKNITLESRLKNDLGIDSLKMLELCVEIENVFNITINEGVGGIETVQDLIDLVLSDNCSRLGLSYNIEDYPLPKTKKDVKRLKKYMWLSKMLWRFEVSGVENIPTDKNYILCPNHQSHFDSLWVWTAISKNRVNLDKICCLAKQEHLQSKKSKTGLVMLGGIPVDRSGNTTPAMKRAIHCIQDGYSVLIHPEGTRTLDGKMQKFKGGSAKLAIDTDVAIIPVFIDGAWDIFPPHRKMPKIFRFGGRYPIKISFGKPIQPNNKTVEELTSILQSEVEKLGGAT